MGTVGVSSPEELSNVCGYLLGIILSTRVCEAAGKRPETEVSWNLGGYPPPPIALESLAGRGFCKNMFAKSRCQRAYRSKSREQRSYGRWVEPRLHRLRLDHIALSWSGAQGQMSQCGCEMLRCSDEDRAAARRSKSPPKRSLDGAPSNCF